VSSTVFGRNHRYSSYSTILQPLFFFERFGYHSL